MTQHKCVECLDTGHKLMENGAHSDYLDCSCEVAQERIAIEREALSFAIDYKGSLEQLPADLRWHFHQRARKIEQGAQAWRIADLERQLSEHKAARIAYASEFQLDKNGDPDVGNIHANIRALKAQLAEASAPAVEQDKVICANLGELLLTPAQRKAADTDKVREALLALPIPVGNGGFISGWKQAMRLAADHIASMAAQAPVREVPENTPTEIRKGFMCANCLHVYDSVQPTQCDCMPKVQTYIECEIRIPALAAAPVQQEGEKP